jgi:hypothetical protein
MASLLKLATVILNEEEGDLADFLKSRKDGAEKIKKAAEEKGGPSLLTATHFAAKDGPYQEAIESASDSELEFCLEQSLSIIKQLTSLDSLSQDQFQALTGQLEAYGEAYILSRDLARGRHLPGSTRRVPEDFDQEALKLGTAMEMEHTSDASIAQSIAMDHLVEDPDYYAKASRRQNVR